MVQVAENKQIADPIKTRIVIDANSTVLVAPSIYNANGSAVNGIADGALISTGVPQELTLTQLKALLDALP